MEDECVATDQSGVQNLGDSEVAEGSKLDAEAASDSDEVASDEEIVLDEPSDTEDYAPPEGDADLENDKDDVSCSSGEEEDGVDVEVVKVGEVQLMKLKFKDVEAKRKERLEQLKSAEEDSDDEVLVEEDNADKDKESTHEAAAEEDKENQKPVSFREYRTSTILDEEMEKDYKSDEDDDFDPIYCGETLSDVEYAEGDDRDTESEPETEAMEGSHRKTGETLVCIKMIEQLQIPPRGDSCSTGKLHASAATASDQPMECV